ncbi:MAG: hypothetical protein JHC95_23065 [Solirubrobacteraceae bacterium]|nr:hypothetical protein [Solirubrobacteraceae bacterium]
MRGWRPLVAGIVAAGIVAALPASAAAGPVTGISDGGRDFFDSPYYRALDLTTVRLVLPWDAGLRDGPWDGWLMRAGYDRADIMVALQHDERSACPSAPCALPSLSAYRASLAALLAKHRQIREVVAWNEPNHGAQPTAGRPEAAAAFHEAARDVCPSCVVVAGNLLDDPSMPAYLERYKRALTRAPQVWGLHSYWDTTYFESRGIDHMLGAVSGDVWLTETGGLVTFGALPFDEQRAGRSVEWAYALADTRPRLSRMYMYQWQGTPTNGFDSGLLDYEGRPRPSYDVVAAQVGRRKTQPEGATPDTPEGIGPGGGSSPVLRPAGKRLRLLGGRRLEVRVACVAAPPERCRGTMRVRIAGATRHRLTIVLRGGRTVRRVVRLSRSSWRSVTRLHGARIGLQFCPRGRACAATVRLPVTLPAARRR